MKILIINCGSSSVKYQLIQTEDEVVLAEGICESIGEEKPLFSYKSSRIKIKKQKASFLDHSAAIQYLLDTITDSENGCLMDLGEIDAVGHRLVHAGEHYQGSVLITEDVLRVMEECIPLAPLHNPANITGVRAIQAIMPETLQAGLFDTAFHQSMPERAYLYALPYSYYYEKKIRRYGFHGTSHQYVGEEAARHLGRKIEDLKIITCHIGNGASITAIDRGMSVDTSMGFTPLEGLVMGTRCGDIDPAIPIFLQKNYGMNAEEVNRVMNKESGILGLSELSNDMRVIEDGVLENKEAEMRAFAVYVYRIKKYIGAYTAVMNGLDVLVFTGGVGENMPPLRDCVCRDMEYLGICFAGDNNNIRTNEIIELHHPESKVKILKISTNEELMIARETEKLVSIERNR